MKTGQEQKRETSKEKHNFELKERIKSDTMKSKTN